MLLCLPQRELVSDCVMNDFIYWLNSLITIPTEISNEDRPNMLVLVTSWSIIQTFILFGDCSLNTVWSPSCVLFRQTFALLTMLSICVLDCVRVFLWSHSQQVHIMLIGFTCVNSCGPGFTHLEDVLWLVYLTSIQLTTSQLLHGYCRPTTECLPGALKSNWRYIS